MLRNPQCLLLKWTTNRNSIHLGCGFTHKYYFMVELYLSL